MNRNLLIAMLENVLTLIVFAAILILAPGLWKLGSFLCLLNLNTFRVG